MASNTVRVGGRKLALVFNLWAAGEIERLYNKTTSELIKDSLKLLDDTQTLLGVSAVMANVGEKMNGGTPDITAEWLGMHLTVTQKTKLQIAAINAMTDGMSMETDDESEGKEVDVTLEEIKKKETAAG